MLKKEKIKEFCDVYKQNGFPCFQGPYGQNHSELLTNITRDHDRYGKKKETYFSVQQKKGVLSKIKEGIVKLENVDKSKINFFEDGRLSRGEIKKLLELEFFEENHVFLLFCILCWGDIRSNNLTKALISYSEWKRDFSEIKNGLRERSISPIDAYSAFNALHLDGPLENLGPAYYTKLIYFLSAPYFSVNQTGYIMDQFTSKSINYLYGEKIIKLDGQGIPKKTNGVEVYKVFLNSISELSAKISSNLGFTSI